MTLGPLSKDTPLTLQQRRFCEEYLIDGKVGAAAFRAGYSFKTRHAQGSQLLADPKIQAYLAERKQKVMSVTGITPERILQELALVAFANVGDYIRKGEDGKAYIDLSDMDRDKLGGTFEIQTNAEGKVFVHKVKVDPAAKIAALVQLGKHQGMFKEQIEHSGAIGLEQLIIGSMEPTKEDNAS